MPSLCVHGQPAYLPTCLPDRVPDRVPACLPAYLPTCLPACLTACLHVLVCERRSREKREPSPWRDRPVEESLKLFDDMRRGLVDEGGATLRMRVRGKSGRAGGRVGGRHAGSTRNPGTRRVTALLRASHKDHERTLSPDPEPLIRATSASPYLYMLADGPQERELQHV